LIIFKSATFRTLAEARFGAEQENPGERMFSISTFEKMFGGTELEDGVK